MLRPPLAALLFASLLTPRVAMADPTHDADRATARGLAYEGQDALDRNDYATAADRFSRADALLHAPTLLLGFARAQVGLGKLISAQEAYQRILREGTAPGASAPFRKAVAAARREVDKLSVRIASVVITVKGPSAPTVTLDGAPVPPAALGIKLSADPGEHVIRATASGFEARSERVTLAEGKSEPVTLELKPAAKAAGGPVGPRAVPSEPTSPPPAPTSDMATPSGSTQKTLGIVALGVGGAGLALGSVTGILTLLKRDELKDRCNNFDCPPALGDTINAYRTLGAISTASFIAGSACAVAGSILLITAPKSRPASGAWVTPLIGAGYLGVAGAF